MSPFDAQQPFVEALTPDDDFLEETLFAEDASACAPQPFVFEVSADGAGQRLDALVAGQLPQITRSRIQKLIEAGHVLVDETPRPKNYKPCAGQKICCLLPAPQPLQGVCPQNIPLEIVYEDDHLLVVNKPKGMVVHPAPGHRDATLVHALLYHCEGRLSGIGGVLRPGIVHRIDKDTSGLLMVAKTDEAHQGLAAQIKDHSFLREYLCVVYGTLKTESFTISAPIGRSKTDRKKMAVLPAGQGREAITHCTQLQKLGPFSLVQCKLETGRTHQIRVHMAHIGHPLAGDAVYGPRKVIAELQGQCLHAFRLGFTHPITNEWLSFESPMPAQMKKFIEKLERTYSA